MKKEILNFRDLAKFNKFVISEMIFRASTLTLYQDTEWFNNFLKKRNIKTIIDLRAKREINENSYHKDFIENYNYQIASFDPWNQPNWFKETEHYGTDTEIAYRFFVKACKQEVKLVFNTILYSKGAIIIHCVAGKDRTGFIIMLLNMLTETPYSIMLKDYLASEMDTTEKKFRIYYDIIMEQGGINNYLQSCNVSKDDLINIKAKLCK